MKRSTPSRRWRPVCAVLAEHTAHIIATERTERTAGAGHTNTSGHAVPDRRRPLPEPSR